MATAQTSSSDQQRSIRPLLFALLILTLLILASYVGRLRGIATLDQQIAAAEINVEQAYSRQQLLKDEQARQVNTNEELIDQAARRDLNLVKPGDFAFTVLTPVPDMLPSLQAEVIPTNPEIELMPVKPNWKQWIDLLIPPQTN